MSKEIRFNSELETLLKENSEECESLSILHRMSYEKYNRRSNYINIPVIILSSAIGFITGIDLQYDKMNIILGVGSVFVGIIKSVDTYFQLAKRAESHRICSLQFSQIYKKIQIELTLNRKQRLTAENMMNIIKTDIKNMQDIAPLIDEDIINLYNAKYRKYKRVKKPNFVNGLTEVKINDAEDDYDYASRHGSREASPSNPNNNDLNGGGGGGVGVDGGMDHSVPDDINDTDMSQGGMNGSGNSVGGGGGTGGTGGAVGAGLGFGSMYNNQDNDDTKSIDPKPTIIRSSSSIVGPQNTATIFQAPKSLSPSNRITPVQAPSPVPVPAPILTQVPVPVVDNNAMLLQMYQQLLIQQQQQQQLPQAKSQSQSPAPPMLSSGQTQTSQSPARPAAAVALAASSSGTVSPSRAPSPNRIRASVSPAGSGSGSQIGEIHIGEDGTPNVRI